MAVNHIPQGYHSVTPYLTIDGAAEALTFYKKVFDAVEVMRFDAPGGKVGYAEIRIGDSTIMLSDVFPEMGCQSPKALGGTPCTLMLYVKDADAMFKHAIAAGARERQPVSDKFYGDRSGTLEDPFGHVWVISTHVEDVSPQEMRNRAEVYMKQAPG